MDSTQNVYCRLCAELMPQNELFDLQTNEEKCRDIITKLARFNVVMNFSDNVLPKTVCFICIMSLNRTIDFVATVEKAQSILHNFILTRQIKQEKSGSDDELVIYHSSESCDSVDPFRNIKVESDQKGKSTSELLTLNMKEDSALPKQVDYTGTSVDAALLSPLKLTQLQQVNSGLNNKLFIFDSFEICKNDESIRNIKVESDQKGKSTSQKEDSALPMTVDHTGTSADATLLSPLKLTESQQVNSVSDDELLNNDSSDSCKNDESIMSLTLNMKEDSALPKIVNYTGTSVDAATLLSQLELTWMSYNWLCTYCETQFPNIDELRTHAMEYHSSCNPYRCTDCKTNKLHLDNFLLHVRKHKRFLRFSCYKCFMVFGDVVSANRHMETHKTTNIVCFGCNMCFDSEQELGNHIATYYRTTWARKPRPQVQGDSLKCPICEKVYRTKGKLSTHLLIHTDRKKDQTCEICGKCFFEKSHLAGHMLQHTDLRPFQCEICKSAFKSPRQLRLHIAIHDGKKPFSCDQCGKSFRLKRHLNNHTIIHTDSFPHTCSICSKSFRSKSLLNVHLRQHTGVKPYSCSICPRDFTNYSNYSKHMKRRHATDVVKKKRNSAGAHPIDSGTREVVDPTEMNAKKNKTKK